MSKVKIFKTKDQQLLYAVKVISDVAKSDQFSRVLIKVVKNAIILSSVGGGMIMTIAFPAESFTSGSYVTTIDDLLLVVSGIRLKNRAVAPEDVTVFFSELKGGNKLTFEFTTIYKEGIAVKNKRTLKLNSPDFAPKIPTIPKVEPVEILASTFKEILQNVYNVAPDSSDNSMVCGSFIEVGDRKMHVKASDGLCVSGNTLPIDSDGRFSCIFPYKFCSKLLKMSTYTEKYKFYYNKNTIFVQGNSFLIGTALPNNSFPDLSPVIKRRGDKVSVLNKNVLMDVVATLLQSVASDHYKKITVIIDPHESTCSLFGNENSVSNIPIKFTSASPCDLFSFDVNASLFKKLISNIDSDEFKIIVNKPDIPIFIETTSPDSLFFSAIAPMRKTT